MPVCFCWFRALPRQRRAETSACEQRCFVSALCAETRPALCLWKEMWFSSLCRNVVSALHMNGEAETRSAISICLETSGTINLPIRDCWATRREKPWESRLWTHWSCWRLRLQCGCLGRLSSTYCQVCVCPLLLWLDDSDELCNWWLCPRPAFSRPVEYAAPCARWRCHAWFEWVPTDTNPADIPSGHQGEEAETISHTFPFYGETTEPFVSWRREPASCLKDR